MAVTLEFPDGSLPTAADIVAALLATTNGGATVGSQLAELDAAVSTRAAATAVTALGTPAQAAALAADLATLLAEIDTRARPSDVQVTVTPTPGVIVGP